MDIRYLIRDWIKIFQNKEGITLIPGRQKLKAAKIIAILLLVYVGIVVIFESLLGYYQPANESTLVITTTDDAGVSKDRVLARIENEGKLYVAANHWPRAWFNQTLDNPEVKVTFAGETADYLAVPATDAEHQRVDSANSLPLAFKFLTGFPPRYFIRLDPR